MVSKIHLFLFPIAQPAEHLSVKQGVIGANPIWGEKN
jgi:hypothetical protein